ncbi:23S rRNA (pseudouridine(1915)-N(3))-methyltransferase RlmH [Candidatus Saccharibacteria bacterium]|nr:23S rRNA (pseudouridine(1915)-N(3))-methyltransferase RlmH [Candidatus Saccharibacteria bacterium]
MRIISGGKKHVSWLAEAISEYEKRLRKTYDIHWEFYDEEKLARKLANWSFDRAREYVICCDERGKNISSPEYARLLSNNLTTGKDIIILIGGAYGFTEDVRQKSDFVWSFSNLVFPHMLARLIVTEQIYRASEIAKGSHYHHE